MADTNYFSGVVRVLENPKESVVKKTIPFVTFRVEVPQIRKNRMVSLMFWGNLAKEVKKYYQKNDYILVEGYVSARNKPNANPNRRTAKKIVITVLRVYPIFLQSKSIPNKL